MSKALVFQKEAERNGWEVKIEEVAPEEVHVYCDRNGEQVYIWWRDNSLIESPRYRYNGSDLSLHNKATATRHLSKKPDAVLAAKRARSKARKHPALTVDILDDQQIEDMQQILPFDIYDSPNSAILKAIRGARITWFNTITGRPESELVPYMVRKHPGADPIYMNTDLDNVFYLAVGDNDRSYLSFMDINGMYRAVYLDRILQVT